MSQLLINKLRAARQSWVILDSAKEGAVRQVQIIRPTETQFGEFLQRGPQGELHVVADVPQCKAYVTDWCGITEADLLGDAVGSSDPLPFSPELWAEVCGDRSEWCRAVSEALVLAITQHAGAKDEAAKN